MRLPNFDSELEPALKDLARALARLDEGQGIAGRRSARQAVSKALRRLRGEVDTQYPAKRRKAKQPRRRRTPQERVRRLRRSGWTHVSASHVLARLASVGIEIRRVEFAGGGVDVLAPNWAIDVAIRAPKRLATAKRDLRERRAILTELAMQKEEK